MRKFMKITIVMVLFLLFAGNVKAVAPTNNYDDWSSFAGNTSNNKTIINKPIKSNEDIKEIVNIKGSFSDYIIIDDIIYTVETRQKELRAYTRDGVLIKSSKLNDSSGFFSRLAYGDNKIFVPLKNSIQAFDIKTFKSLWESKKENGQMISSITYYNGYIYSGLTIPKGVSTEPSDGFYFAINTKAKLKDNKIMDYAWKYEEKSNSGFYWAGGTIVNGTIVFVGDNGKIIIHDLVQDIIYDTLDISKELGYTNLSKVRANINYNRATNILTIGTQENSLLINIKVKDFTFDRQSLISTTNPAGITGGIATAGNYTFVPSGGMFGSSYTIYDTNLKQIYTNKTTNTQSYPLINTNPDGSLTSYIIDFTSGAIIINTIKEGKVTENKVKISELQPYNSGGIIANKNGDLIVSSFGGDLLVIKNKDNEYTNTEQTALLKLIPSTLTYDDKELVTTINNRIGVDNKTLNALHEAILIEIKKVESAISNLNTDINNDINLKTIRDVYIQFNNLDYEDQQQVINKDILINLIKQINAGEEGKKANAMVNKINKIVKNPTLDDEKTINQLYKEYNSYSPESKSLVTNINILLNKKAIIDKLRKIVDKINDDIINLPLEISSKDLVKINSIISDYNKLSKINKKYVEGIAYVYSLKQDLAKQQPKKAHINYANGVLKANNNYIMNNHQNKGDSKHNDKNDNLTLSKQKDFNLTHPNQETSHISNFSYFEWIIGVGIIAISILLLLRYLKKD